MHLYRSYNQYIQDTYHQKGYRISIDGGFSCPNRSQDRTTGGCTFCDASGSRPEFLGNLQSIENQISSGIERVIKKHKARIFFLYFQSYTSTFGTVSKLREIYHSALQQAPFKELIISTRPDCLDDKTVALLVETGKIFNIPVWVELGLQSVHNKTLKRVNRGHDYQQFLEAYSLLKTAGINCAVHLIYGLPGEEESDMQQTLLTVAGLDPEGIKFHNLHIPTEAPLYQEFSQGELPVISNERYIQLLAWSIERLPPHTVIMRISTDTPSSRSGRYPGLVWNKFRYIQSLENLLVARGTGQGSHYQKAPPDYG